MSHPHSHGAACNHAKGQPQFAVPVDGSCPPIVGVCPTCPIFTECLNWALTDNPIDVWAGGVWWGTSQPALAFTSKVRHAVADHLKNGGQLNAKPQVYSTVTTRNQAWGEIGTRVKVPRWLANALDATEPPKRRGRQPK